MKFGMEYLYILAFVTFVKVSTLKVILKGLNDTFPVLSASFVKFG